MTDSMNSAPLTLIHTSDWHLGHELAGHGRLREHDGFLAWLLDEIEAQDADVLLVTGDVYDVANPSVAAMRQLYAFLAAAIARRPWLTVVILGGNHDSAARIELPGHLLDQARVHFIGALPRKEGAIDHASLLIPLARRSGEVAAWLAAVPFCRPGDLGAHTLQTLYDEVAREGAASAGDLPLILSGHLHVAGGEVSELSERRIVVGGEEAQAATLFDARAAYVALGHLHRAQDIAGPTRIRYAGSPIPLSVTERDYRHSISVCRVSPGKSAVDVAEVAIPSQVPFLCVPARGEAGLDAVVAELEALAPGDLPRDAQPFLEVTVTVDGPEPHLQTRVLAALEDKPVRLTRIVRRHATAPVAAAGPLAGADLGELLPDAVFAALHAARHNGHPPGDDLARAFAQLLVEVNAAPSDTQTEGAA